MIELFCMTKDSSCATKMKTKSLFPDDDGHEQVVAPSVTSGQFSDDAVWSVDAVETDTTFPLFFTSLLSSVSPH